MFQVTKPDSVLASDIDEKTLRDVDAVMSHADVVAFLGKEAIKSSGRDERGGQKSPPYLERVSAHG